MNMCFGGYSLIFSYKKRNIFASSSYYLMLALKKTVIKQFEENKYTLRPRFCYKPNALRIPNPALVEGRRAREG